MLVPKIALLGVGEPLKPLKPASCWRLFLKPSAGIAQAGAWRCKPSQVQVPQCELLKLFA